MYWSNLMNCRPNFAKNEIVVQKMLKFKDLSSCQGCCQLVTLAWLDDFNFKTSANTPICFQYMLERIKWCLPFLLFVVLTFLNTHLGSFLLLSVRGGLYWLCYASWWISGIQSKVPTHYFQAELALHCIWTGKSPRQAPYAQIFLKFGDLAVGAISRIIFF